MISEDVVADDEPEDAPEVTETGDIDFSMLSKKKKKKKIKLPDEEMMEGGGEQSFKTQVCLLRPKTMHSALNL